MTGLDQIRVLELGEGIGPAYAGWLLSTLGASVTKVVSPRDRLCRQSGGLMFGALNRGKSLVDTMDQVDIAEPAVIVEGLRWPEYEAIAEKFQEAVAADRIVASVSTFGRQGPYRARRGFSLQAVAGSVARRMGRPDQAPLTFPLDAVDYVGGLMTAAGVLLALRADVPGQHVDVSTLDIVTNVYNRNGVAQAAGGGMVRGERHGHRFGTGIIGTFRCADGYVSLVTLLYKHWERFFEEMGGAHLLDEPRFNLRGAPLIPEAREELEGIINGWLSKFTRAELFELFQRIRVPFQPVNTLEEVLAEPHLDTRGFWDEVPLDGRIFKVPASPTRQQRVLEGTRG